ncbi:hypothetical protein BGX28_003515 [Mortierella sp. GBA30]|nr:hypothetical protein BGX28_003515 [Mortierella sp. GBA30]
MTSKELGAFLVWAEENEILWDKSAIEVKEGKHGLGVYAKKRLDAGVEVIQVPKSIVLSVETTGIANLLEDDEIEGYIGLTLGCMYEQSRDAQSPWSPYLALLAKRPPQMATSLSKAKRELMKYCEVYNEIESDIKDLQDDYDTIVVPFIERHPDVFPKEIKEKYFSFEAFKVMTGHVSSRAMDVDNFHVSSLVPFADLVNHSPYPNADYLTHEDVCEICGALACEHLDNIDGDDEDDEGSEKDSDEDNLDDDEDEEKVPQLAGMDDDDDNEAPELTGEKDEEEEEEWEDDEDEDNEGEDDDDEDEEINDTCDIILDAEVKKGEEITRHYGPYPNKVLLSKYGFAVEDNPHDTVTIQLEMVRQAAEKILKDEKLVDERIQWFLETEDVFIGEDDGDDHEHGGGCCGGGDHEHDHDHDHGDDAEDEKEEGHKHAADGECCGEKPSKRPKKGSKDETASEKAGVVEKDEDEGEDDDEEVEEEEEESFPRDIMYMMPDGSVDDRLLMLLNVLFMDKDQFQKVQEDMDVAMEYFNDVFMRRQQEEHGDDDEDMDEDDEGEEDGQVMRIPTPKMEPRDEKSKKVRGAVLEAILALIRLRAEAFGVTDKTTAEQDLESLKKAKLTGPVYYGGLCVQGEKQILQNGLRGYDSFLAEL